ncbi:hypothetical protein D1823_07345 [Ruegeria sp. AD91A]|uniref:peroxidase family protein n=1 Tax=Ruegeria sp. AD91A TaxID=2293862 RepID=UPI000E488125|nr:peroxidase family protein [Ruegeria sp. AD91A]AXT26405.1 hypothetical protein D1823_07345 [Ruegeria sp. AD91A]
MPLIHGGNLYFIRDSHEGADKDGPEIFSYSGPDGRLTFRLERNSYDSPDEDKRRTFALPAIDPADAPGFQKLLATATGRGAETMSVDRGNAASSDWDAIQLYDRLISPEEVNIHTHDDDFLESLGEAIAGFVPEEPPLGYGPHIPAAYTYFGQFVAHDMSHMQWLPGIGPNGEDGWINGEQPHGLDFSSLFGTAPNPDTPTSQWQEKAGSALGLVYNGAPGITDARDLPRAGSTGRHCCVDPRTDDNLALAQMQVLLVRFHQALSAELVLDTTAGQRETRRHLQAVTLTDYLPRIVDSDIYEDILQNGPTLVNTSGAFFVPIEFAAACFRFGHTMVRDVYSNWIIQYPPGSNISVAPAEVENFLFYTSAGGGLNQNQLTGNWAQAWRHMVDHQNPDLPPAILARPIQASIERDLHRLDHALLADLQNPAKTGKFNLATKTLRRGASLSLPSGQQLETVAGISTPFDIGAFLDSKPERYGHLNHVTELRTHTPLWFFILAEAEAAGSGKLGKLGSRIVTETIRAAITAVPDSILSAEPFQRGLRTDHGLQNTFTLRDVVAVAYGGVD